MKTSFAFKTWGCLKSMITLSIMWNELKYQEILGLISCFSDGSMCFMENEATCFSKDLASYFDFVIFAVQDVTYLRNHVPLGFLHGLLPICVYLKMFRNTACTTMLFSVKLLVGEYVHHKTCYSSLHLQCQTSPHLVPSTTCYF